MTWSNGRNRFAVNQKSSIMKWRRITLKEKSQEIFAEHYLEIVLDFSKEVRTYFETLSYIIDYVSEN